MTTRCSSTRVRRPGASRVTICGSCRWHLRKNNLAQLLARRPEGIFVSEFEQGEIGPDLVRVACNFGLEGMVSKRRDRPYRAGRSADWIKVKNRKHPAIERVKESFFMNDDNKDAFDLW